MARVDIPLDYLMQAMVVAVCNPSGLATKSIACATIPSDWGFAHALLDPEFADTRLQPITLKVTQLGNGPEMIREAWMELSE